MGWVSSLLSLLLLTQLRLPLKSQHPQVFELILHQATHLLIGSLTEASAIVQVVAFFWVWLGLWLPIAIPLAIALKWRPNHPITPEQKLPLLASLYLLAPFIVWGFAQIVGATGADYGVIWQVSTLTAVGVGFGIGVLGIVLLFGLQLGLGWISWPPYEQNTESTGDSPNRSAIAPQAWLPWQIWLPTLLLGFWVSAVEELVFRGFLLTQLQQDYAGWLAGAIASAIFAVLHLIWEGRENVPQLPGLWLLGMVLVLARWTNDGNLGMACGLHAGWIWTIASLESANLIHYTGRGPIWLTGFSGKPLAGGLGLLLLVATGGVILLVDLLNRQFFNL